MSYEFRGGEWVALALMSSTSTDHLATVFGVGYRRVIR